MNRIIQFVLLSSIILFSQSSRMLNWEELSKFLPKIEKVSDLKRGDITGGNDPNAYVSLLYFNSQEIVDRSKEISIFIEDYSTKLEYIEDELGNAPDISEPILINGKYKGIKIISMNDSVIEYCTYHFIVAGRFLISIDSTTEGDFSKEIEILIDNFDYDGLEKLK